MRPLACNRVISLSFFGGEYEVMPSLQSVIYVSGFSRLLELLLSAGHALNTGWMAPR